MRVIEFSLDMAGVHSRDSVLLFPAHLVLSLFRLLNRIHIISIRYAYDVFKRWGQFFGECACVPLVRSVPSPITFHA